MTDYNVSFYAAQDGGFVLDIHTTTGTSPYLKFSSIHGLREFFASLGISEDGLAEIEKICSALKPGHAYHEQMFLPESVMDAMETRIAETGGLVNGALPNAAAFTVGSGRAF